MNPTLGYREKYMCLNHTPPLFPIPNLDTGQDLVALKIAIKITYLEIKFDSVLVMIFIIMALLWKTIIFSNCQVISVNINYSVNASLYEPHHF